MIIRPLVYSFCAKFKIVEVCMAHIRKSGKTYSYVVDIGEDPFTGKRKQISKGGFIRKKDAEAAAPKIELLLDENRHIVLRKVVFSEYIQNWFENHYQNRIKQTSAANSKYILEKHILRENPFAIKEIAKITTADIDHFYNLKLKGNYSTSYIRKMHQLLNQAFSQALDGDGRLSLSDVTALTHL